jgi:hypothetical protein
VNHCSSYPETYRDVLQSLNGQYRMFSADTRRSYNMAGNSVISLPPSWENFDEFIFPIAFLSSLLINSSFHFRVKNTGVDTDFVNDITLHRIASY